MTHAATLVERHATDRWLILADDLTGAADCAIAFARRGLSATVSWGDHSARTGAAASVFSYDADSRGMTAERAAARHAVALGKLLGPDRLLFKKIDSTLRGQPAAEIAATIAHLQARCGSAFGILAPAFPGTQRTTVDGRIRVSGRPLEEAEVWRRDHSYASADLVEVLAAAGVVAGTVGLAAVRGAALRAALDAVAARGSAVAVCDAETDDDLRRIAAASQPMPPGRFLIGSAGLAHALAAGLPDGRAAAPSFAGATGGSLIVVGTLATASRAGARRLVAGGGVVHVPVEPGTLLSEPAERAAVGLRVAGLLGAGEDVLVEIRTGDAPDLALGPSLARALAEALAPAASRMGAFAATGGETAAALLSGFGVDGIQLVDEVEPGVALGITLGHLSVPVVTKAGAFGDERSLRRIAARLRAIRSKGTLA